ncbi:hypothetical protein EML15_05405 [Corynebacterium sp. sy017]|uniref:hypothetical protein n=1 Tax=unclassified Corynebacterium TaxID=2624378 RepID=UPI001185A301|nr:MULTISPECIES: hypothetical protein [unclassified Corynebacterium]MBP3088583.1 hypothetical protein [Corynebacterium sp. sy017]TSD91878.1 hypothetical protein ELY17_05405 [Corynebacterium sp. SY003]
MEDEPVKSLKATARRGALISVSIAAGLALASCSAGQITQTSTQVAAVDGSEGNTEDGKIVVRDVTVHLDNDGNAGLKFAVVNQDPADQAHTLESVSVGGKEVALDGSAIVESNCSLLGDLKSELDKLQKPGAGVCISHIGTKVDGAEFTPSGNQPVKFTFDNGTIEISATVSEAIPQAGTNAEDVENDINSQNSGEHH